MPDPETAALLRSILDELCLEVPISDSGTRTNVAWKLLEAVGMGHRSLDDLKEIGRDALHRTPTMWP